ncbi:MULTISPECIES: hypothetical protein [Natrialba]|uniref:Metal dependent phosphohydrolase n=1 Tax=Natrialba chahannaoensis JCM 10990 TaxID=1227492 RepID=M0AE09_9EURY|nr:MULTISPECIES: hypothetical protein [Natrialba]ELY96636.1 hypothetical protein C482_15448 [Natrialba chahannaoensis JCM 10990]OIB59383.1 hypothetical protein BBD46_01525 [Natrialba sp. SSL1]
MPDLAPQEDLLVIEALVEYHDTHADEYPERASHAKVVASAFAHEHGLMLKDALRQREWIEI